MITEDMVGRQRAFTVENTSLRIVALPDHGGDLLEFHHKPTKTDFLWRAPGWEESVAVIDNRGTFFDQYLGGWHEMLPCFGAGRLHGAQFGLCGEATMLPWEARVERDDLQEACLRLSVRLRRLPLRVTKRLRMRPDSSSLIIDETLLNDGAQPIDFAWGHHPVLGGSFLGPDCRIEVPGGRVVASGPGGEAAAVAEGTEGEWPRIQTHTGDALDLSRVKPHSPGWEEDFHLPYILEPWVGVTNTRTGIGFGLAWKTEEFPHLWLWHNYGGRLDYPWYGSTYCLGLEPLSSLPFDIEGILAAGSQCTLGPGQERSTRLCATVYRSKGALKGVDLDGTATFGPARRNDGAFP